MGIFSFVKNKFSKPAVSRINNFFVKETEAGPLLPLSTYNQLNSNKKIYSLVKKAGESFRRHGINYDAHFLLQREILFIRDLQNHKNFPVLLASDTNYLEMKYAGERISKDNVPQNFDSQVKEILKVLSGKKIIHRDIKAQNLVVLNGNLTLIDFGWAIYEGENYPCPQDQESSLSRNEIYDNQMAFVKLKKAL